MVLIVSDCFDAHADIIEQKIHELGKRVFRLNLDLNSLSTTILSFENNVWTICVGGNSIKSHDVSCVYFRRAFMELSVEEMSLERDIGFRLFRNEFNTILNGLWFSLNSTKAFNPLKNAYVGENKFFQLQVARQVGLSAPKTLVSNDRMILEKFINAQEEVIFYRYPTG